MSMPASEQKIVKPPDLNYSCPTKEVKEKASEKHKYKYNSFLRNANSHC